MAHYKPYFVVKRSLRRKTKAKVKAKVKHHRVQANPPNRWAMF